MATPARPETGGTLASLDPPLDPLELSPLELPPELPLLELDEPLLVPPPGSVLDDEPDEEPDDDPDDDPDEEDPEDDDPASDLVPLLAAEALLADERAAALAWAAACSWAKAALAAACSRACSWSSNTPSLALAAASWVV
jgi:hypothetical protein